MIREKNTKSGRLFEVDFYPVWDDGRKMPVRASKTKRSTEEQQKYNNRQAEKKLIRLINANFDESDIIMHPTYSPENAPTSEEAARKDVINYLRRVKTRRASELKKIKKALDAMPFIPELKEQRDALIAAKKKLEQPFKYIYVIERVTYKRGEYAGTDNWHMHMFISGGLDRDVLEEMWPNGIRTNADKFQPNKYGPEAIAKYMCKDPQGRKRFCQSRNLDKPKVKNKDGKVSPGRVARMAGMRADDAAYWERRYKGYRFLRCYNRFNEYNGYWYVSVVMYKTDADAPRWDYDEWLDEQN